ncbi:hypothetical protein [Luteimonas sp. R10]|uniref:hypothetical protein n=1 Tax=Luteimonas sp. R10 TaxID=3108176 RepID=UPI0030935A59|nr:hypothetical protein U3649_17040 [Luteimonas sp. R10]
MRRKTDGAFRRTRKVEMRKIAGKKHMSFRALAFAALAFAMVFPLTIGEAVANYTAEQIFRIETEEASGFSRREIDLGDTGFSFSTLVKNGMDISTGEGAQEPGEPIARIYEPENREALMIEVHHVEFPSFAEAPSAGYGFLARQGYNRVLQDKAKSNAGFGYLAGSVVEENGDYTRMARVAAITHGKDVLIIYAVFDYDAYPEVEEAVAHFLGAIKMDETGAPADALRDMKTSSGERFLVPTDLALQELDTKGEPSGTSDYTLTLEGQEYPNLLVMIRPITLEEGRDLGVKMIDQFTKQVEENPKASFAGEAQLQTHKSDNGEPTAHSYARGWDTDTSAYLVSEFMIQENADAEATSIIALNTFDVRRGIDTFDDEAKDIIFKSWVAGASAYSATYISLQEGADHYLRDLDIRAIGH